MNRTERTGPWSQHRDGQHPDARRAEGRQAAWVIGVAAVGLVFDGYDLVVGGIVTPVLLRDPAQIGPLDPSAAGVLAALALVGVLVGALVAGFLGDRLGRRRVLLVSYAWFSVGMGATALAPDAVAFGALRFLTGLGIGAVVATTAPLVSEWVAPQRRHLAVALVYCGIPLGSLLGAVVALVALDTVGWRGMFWVGALPLVTILPPAVVKLRESPSFAAADPAARPGPGTLFGPTYRRVTLLLGLVAAAALLLIFALGTWLPELLARAGFSTAGSLTFLAVLNGGAVVGALLASRVADRVGARWVVAGSFLLGALGMLAMTADLPVGVLLALVAVVGLGTTGTQILVVGLAAERYRTDVRSAGVGWCTGFGRVGGIVGPLVVGLLVAGGLGLDAVFTLLAALAVAGAALTALLPRRTV